MVELEKIREVLSGTVGDPVDRPKKTKLASVLVIICGQEPSVIMTKRSQTMNNHAGEISFPGGSWQENDPDLLSTALRETREELGAVIQSSDVTGMLAPDTTLNSGFTIFPFITVRDGIPEMRPNTEIECVLKIPLIPLLGTMGIDRDPAHRSILEMFTFQYHAHLIWGASARILHQINSKLSQSNLL